MHRVHLLELLGLNLLYSELQILRRDDGLDDTFEDPFTAKMSFEVKRQNYLYTTSWRSLRERRFMITCGSLSVRAAGGFCLCPGQSEPLRAALDEQEGRPDQTLARATPVGILPLPDA